MTGKSPDRPQPEEHFVEPASWLPPIPVLSPLLSRRLGARVLDPETTALAPGQPAPLPTVYVSDTLLVRDVISASLDDGLSTRVEELVGLASRLPDPFVVKTLGEPVAVPAQGEAARALGPDAQVTVTRIRLSPDPDRATKSPDAWRFLQTALTEPSERGTRLYDKLGLGRLPDPPEGEKLTDSEQKRRERRDRRGRSLASGVSIEHVLTAGGGIWGGGGGIWGGGAASGAAAAASGAGVAASGVAVASLSTVPRGRRPNSGRLVLARPAERDRALRDGPRRGDSRHRAGNSPLVPRGAAQRRDGDSTGRGLCRPARPVPVHTDASRSTATRRRVGGAVSRPREHRRDH